MNEIKIHDIKGLVEIPDISFYIYILLWILAILFISIILFLLFKFLLNRGKNKRKEYYKTLKELDLNDSKAAAYTITKCARLLAKSDREKKLLSELIEELEPFKYKKQVYELDENVKITFARFMDSIDV